MRSIDIVPYDPRWPVEFRSLALPLRYAVGDLALRIDHIGSTSIPDLPAKDIIDIQMTVASLHPAERLTKSLAALGYTRREEYSRDHLPSGADPNPVEWEKLYFNPPPGQRDTHLHVRVEGRVNQRYPLLFRDYLRRQPAAAAAYAEVKRQLARHGPEDWDLYYDVKDPVCDVIMAGAFEWAEATGWRQGPSDV